MGLMGIGSSAEEGAAEPERAEAAAAAAGVAWGQPTAASASGSSWAQRARTGIEFEEEEEEEQEGEQHDDTSAPAAPAWPAIGESQEDAELQAAIQASLADAAAAAAAATRPRSTTRACALQPAGGPPTLVAGGDDLGLAGLRNETGEYNCFLNTIIQCLWRCADFRQQVGVYLLKGSQLEWSAACLLADTWIWAAGCFVLPKTFPLCLLTAGLQVAGWDAAFCAADPIVGTLHTLFQQFEQQEQQRDSASSGEGLAPVDPGPLREALAALPGQQFGVGE